MLPRFFDSRQVKDTKTGGDMDKDWPKQKRRGGRRDDITTEGVQTFDMTAAELCEHFRRMTLKSAAYRKRYERRRWGWGYE